MDDPNCLGEDIMAVRNSIGEAAFSDFLKGTANDVLSNFDLTDQQLSLAYLLKKNVVSY